MLCTLCADVLGDLKRARLLAKAGLRPLPGVRSEEGLCPAQPLHAVGNHCRMSTGGSQAIMGLEVRGIDGGWPA